MLTIKQKEEIKQLKHEIEQGDTYASFRTAVARKNSELGLDGRQEESDLWKEGIGKYITEPGFIKYVLAPLGKKATLATGYHEDMTVDGREEDLKAEFSPYFNGPWGPTYTRTMDREDVRYGGKYLDDFVLRLWTVRVPGLQYRMGKNSHIIVTYDGPALDIVCETTVGECRRLIREHNLKPRPLWGRIKEEHQGQNEQYMFDFDIRWFPMKWRYQNGVWLESAWTEEEKRKTPQEILREAADEDEDEIPNFVSRFAAKA